jgi:hypothetical protein
MAESVVGTLWLRHRVDGKENLSGMGHGMLESRDVDGQSVTDIEQSFSSINIATANTAAVAVVRFFTERLGRRENCLYAIYDCFLFLFAPRISYACS